MNNHEQKYLPVFLNITGKKILIVGGGKVALHKFSSIKLFTNEIAFLSVDFSKEIEETDFKKIQKSYEKQDLAGYHIIYACTNNKLVNEKIKQDANMMGLPVNVADDPILCDFISPAVYKQESITVAVSSNAQNVKKAIKIRDKIKNLLENDPSQSI